MAPTPSPVSTIDLARSLAGEFDVTSSGQATYKIPVETAPGSAGLVPNVSLNYSSGGGNGLLGLGWSLSAYGAISRCRQTEGVDGVAKPITWTNEDRFCLNGDRLLLVSGSYGVSGSTYKTEVDSFARITAVGGSTGHPDYFTVEYKDGMVETYGNTTDSYNSKNQLSSSVSTTVLDWALSKRSDSASNKIVYNYVKDSDGQRLDSIDYAFGSTTTRGAYLQFSYENRNDPISGYVAGYSYRTGKRLSGVKSYNGTTEIRSYVITYNQASAYTTNDKLSRINKVQECVGYVCSPATEFEWELPDYQLAAVTSTKTFTNGISQHAMGDFNGDGLQDIAWFDTAVETTSGTNSGMLVNRPMRYAFGKIDYAGKFIFENQTFDSGSYAGPSLNSRVIKSLDINNDGRMDIAVDGEYKNGTNIMGTEKRFLSVPMPDGSWKLSVQPATGSSQATGIPVKGVPFTRIALDINGDGLLDNMTWPLSVLPWDAELGFTEYPPSVNQYSLTHILVDPSYKNNATYDYQPDANFQASLGSAPINYITNLTGDFNGDGAMDLVAYAYNYFSGCFTHDEGERYCDGWLTTSRSALYTTHKTSSGYELRHFNFDSVLLDNWDLSVDLNNDGLSDFVTRESGWGVRINDGTTFSAFNAIGVSLNPVLNISNNLGNQEALLADINADGYQDFVWEQPPSSTALTGTSTIKARYWDPAANTFEATERSLAVLPYLVKANYQGHARFKTTRFSMPDVNGDGIPDLVSTPNPQSADSVVTVNLGVHTKKNANKIIAIKNGWGEQKKIQYGRVNEGLHYFRLDGISLPGSEQKCEDVIQTNSDDTQYVEHMCWTEYSGAVDSTAFYQAINNPWFDLTAEEQSLRPASPVLEAFGPMSIVTDVEVTAPSGSKSGPQQIDSSTTAKLSYYYGHAKMQAGGRGFLGFRYFTVVNRETGIRTETEYRQDWPYLGNTRSVKTFTADGYKLNEQFNTWGFVNCHDTSGNPNASCVNAMSAQVDASGTGALGAVQPFLRKSITHTYALKDNGLSAGDLLSTTTETNRNDTKGNSLETTSITTGSNLKDINKTTVNTYDYSGSTWSMQQGRLQRMSVTANDSTYGSVTRTSSFTYSTSGADIGLLKTETIEPDNSTYTVTTTHTYSMGNKTKSVIVANGQTRQSEVAYDSRGRYVDKTYGFLTNGTNPDSAIRQLVSEVISRDKYGTPTEVRSYTSSSNYVTKKVATTDFGTPYFTADSTGTFAEIKIGTGSDTYGVCPADNKIWTITQSAGGAISIQCSDILGRVRRAGSIGFDGNNWSLVDTEYDKLGRTLHTSVPYWRNSSERYWTSQTYDVLGRVTETRSPYKSGYVTTVTAYENLNVTITNPKGQVRTEKRDLAGQIIEVIDPNSGITKFAYDSRGNMREMKDPAGNTTTVTYDLRDRKIGMSDPDKGTYVYQYNSFGDITCQMDGKGQISVNRYDIAGRLFSRTDRMAGGTCANPTGSIDKYSQWTYDTATNGWGQLANTFDSATVGGSAQYQQSFSYDSLGRVSSTTTTMPGHNNAVGSHYEKVLYDQYGRVDITFDAARSSQTFTSNGVKNIYNAQGYLESVKDAFLTNGIQRTYYKVNSMNARGNVTSAEYANGVTQVADYYPENGLTKTLRASRAMVGLPVQDINLDWDEVGNLSWREELGTAGASVRRNIRETFSYDSLNRLRTWVSSGDLSASETANYNNIDNITDKTGVGNYLYGSACGTGTNAGPHALCRAGSTNYTYDKNGNMLTDSSGRTMAYTSYDLPSQISKSGHSTSFSYGPSRARYKRVDTSSSQITTTLYLGSVEKVYYPDGSIEWKRNIAGVGLITQKVNSSGVLQSEAQRYLIKDHLGSLSLITDEIGAVEQSQYFDPWGKERKIVTSGSVKQWLADNTNFRMANKPITTRGFTGHEQLAEVGLIHMNGRIYDGTLGRFVQADPIIQDPLRVQSLNRYSYVWNNPLNATDPSGFNCDNTGSGNGCDAVEREQNTEAEQEIIVTGQKPKDDNRVDGQAAQVIIKLLSGTGASGTAFSSYAISSGNKTWIFDKDLVDKMTNGDIKNLDNKIMDKIISLATVNGFAQFSVAAEETKGANSGGFWSDFALGVSYAAQDSMAVGRENPIDPTGHGSGFSHGVGFFKGLEASSSFVRGGALRGGKPVLNARDVADREREKGRERGAASQLDTEDGRYLDTSGPKPKFHYALQTALDNVPVDQRSKWHGYCSELGCINRALIYRSNLNGARMTTVAIGESNPGHGMLKKACPSCAAVMDQLGIKYD
jgi:RHS repeat-associated protein